MLVQNIVRNTISNVRDRKSVTQILARIRDLSNIRVPHERQLEFINSPAKRKVIRAGRRGGKTTGIAIDAAQTFLSGRRVLYGAPTQEQVDRFWTEIKAAFRDAIDAGLIYKNETLHILEIPQTEIRIRAKTAWNADSLRGDYADKLILDEFQLMSEDTWGAVGAPMLLDNNGDAVFIYTPPSLHSRSVTKASDPRHAPKMFKKAKEDTTGKWEAFHFSSHDNPHISKDALVEITGDMTAQSYRQEILAEDSDEAPGALWKRDNLDTYRVTKHPELIRVVIGVDPPGGATECGIIGAGIDTNGHGYILDDKSIKDSPEKWGSEIITLYNRLDTDRVVGEINYGGDMVESVIRSVEGGKHVSFKAVRATRGKAIRAEPIAAFYERGMVHHVGTFPHLEEEMCNWEPSHANSPNRMDALVWALTELMGNGGSTVESESMPEAFMNWRGG